MGGHSPEDIKKETRTYILVFVALAALTVVTVGISYLDLNVGAAVTLAMIIAVVKGSLVALFFMHLISEEKLIYAVLLLTVFFFAVLMFLPAENYLDDVGQRFTMEGVGHPEGGGH
jgi:cytochrome c oxidase subunit 4